MQKSAVKGSQGGCGVTVIVGVKDGVTDGTMVAGMEGGVEVATACVFTITTGVSVTPVVVQAVRIKVKRRLSIFFINESCVTSLQKAFCNKPELLYDCCFDCTRH
jgi:hypothetical protein